MRSSEFDQQLLNDYEPVRVRAYFTNTGPYPGAKAKNGITIITASDRQLSQIWAGSRRLRRTMILQYLPISDRQRSNPQPSSSADTLSPSRCTPPDHR